MPKFLSVTFIGWLVVVPPILAAPPGNGWLFPAGGQRGQSVMVESTEKIDPWPVEIAVEGDGFELVAEADAGKFRLEIAANAAPGLRWVRLYNAEGASQPIPLVIGTLPETNEVEPNDQPTQAHAIATSNITVNGRLNQAADIDTYAVELRAGQTLVAHVAANHTLASPMDATLQILTPQGIVLRQCDDAVGLDPQIAFTATRDGAVLVRLFAFPAAPNQTIGLSSGGNYLYRLTLTTGPFVDYCLPLAAQSGQPTAGEPVGWNFAPSASPSLTGVVDEAHSIVTLFDATMAGCASVPLIACAAPKEIEPNDATQPQALSVACVVSGRISKPRDADVYAIALRKDRPIVVRAECLQLGFPLNPLVTIAQAETGGEVFRQGDAGPLQDIDATFTPPVDGVYHLAISDLARQGGPRHAYRLSLLDEPDYKLHLSTGEFRIAAGKPLEITVDVSRQLNFTGEIEITIIDLPAGSTCAPVISKPGDDSSKQVKLTLQTGTSTFNGPLCIRGKSLGEVALERIAGTAPATGQAFTPPPWLTITAAE